MPGSKFNEVAEIAAERGWGPIRYYTTMALSSLPLAPNQDPNHISQAAQAVWAKMPSDMVSKFPISNSPHSGISPGFLDYSYTLKPEKKKEIKQQAVNAYQRHKELIKQNPQLKAEVDSAVKNYLDVELAKIY
jgi:hypothetical protein